LVKPPGSKSVAQTKQVTGAQTKQVFGQTCAQTKHPVPFFILVLVYLLINNNGGHHMASIKRTLAADD
jgi:hypothetical protein